MINRDIAKALLVAPSVGPLLYCIGAGMLMAGENNQGSVFGMAALVLGVGLPIGYVATLVIGLPIYTFLKNRRMFTIYKLYAVGRFRGL